MALSWRQVHLAAAAEAVRAHRDLGIDSSRPVDPLAALDAAGVLVFRRRLDGVAGLYLPGDATGGAPGVLINVVHPPTKQRFTAAHELWHHRRDRMVALDTETEWIARGGQQPHPDRERLAEAFAAWFLMPRKLVEASVGQLRLNLVELDADGAYALALAMGTSYAATVYHLADMGLIDAATRSRLAQVPPQRIKRNLSPPGVASDSWKDIRVVRFQTGEDVHDVQAEEGDAVVIEVPETPSSGYVWEVALVADGLAPVGDEYRAAEPRALGGRGWHRFLVRVDTAGYQLLRLDLRRPWEAGPAVESIQVGVTAAPAPAPGIVRPQALVPAA